MKMIVGLGNPGDKYQSTRHNIGFMVINEMTSGKSWLKSKSGLLEYVWLKKDADLELIKPLTYMNKSGDAVSYAMKKHTDLSLNDLWVIHDDLDIELGKYKIQKGKGPKDHNGVGSVERVLGDKDFWRVRVGVENRGQKETNKQQISNNNKINLRIPGEKYVLQSFNENERKVVESVVEDVCQDILRRLDELV